MVAQNQVGLNNIFKLVSESYKDDNFYRYPRMDYNLLSQYSDGVIASSACLGGVYAGNYWDNKDEFDKALPQFKKAIQIQPKNAHGYFTLANSLYNNKNWEEAIENYRVSLKLKPELTQARANLKIVLRKVENKK